LNRTAPEILEEARQLPPGDLDWLIQNLINEGDGASEEERFAARQKEVGEPGPEDGLPIFDSFPAADASEPTRRPAT